VPVGDRITRTELLADLRRFLATRAGAPFRLRLTGPVAAEVDLGEARRKRNWNAFNQVLRDRRSDVYDEMLGSGLNRGWY